MGNEDRSLFGHLVIVGRLNRRFRLSFVYWGLISFSLYYICPLLLCAAEGVLMNSSFAPLRHNVELDMLNRTIGRADASIPYLKDLTHLLMALVVSSGGTLCVVALSEFRQVYNTLSDPNVLRASKDCIAAEHRRMEGRVANRTILIPITLIAASSGIVLYYNGRSAVGWWGNSEYGPAGVLLSCLVSLVLFYGMHAMYILAVAQYSIGRLVSHGVRLRPFHADGCNGFAKLGNLLLLLLIVCILSVTAVWITLWHGYLGIEDFPGIWLAALAIVLCIPLIVIQPLAHVSIEIRRAQLLRLSPVERLLNDLLKGTEDQLLDVVLRSAKLEDMKALRDFHLVMKDIYETSVFPFNRRVASALSVGYIVQAVALATEVIKRF